MNPVAGTSSQVARSGRRAGNRVLATCITTRLALGAVVMLPSIGWAQETYVCVEEQATGFIFDKARRTWQPSVLIAERRLVLQLDQGTPRTWFVTEPRRRESSYWCPSGWINDEITCAGAMGQFWMNRKTRRFMYVYKWGYLDGDTPDTPNLTIGTCRPL